MRRLLSYLSLLIALGWAFTAAITGGTVLREGLQESPIAETNPLQALSVSEPLPMEDQERDRNPLDQGNDNCPATVIGGLPYTDSGTTAGRANNWNTAASCAGGGGGSNAPDVIYSYTPGAIENVVISTCGSGFNTLLELRANGGCPGVTQMSCADAGCGGDAELRVTLMSGLTYYIIVDGYGTQSGNYTLTVAQMCNITAQAGDLAECAETVDSSHARLDCNGGPCNVAYNGTASYTYLSCGQTYFGHSFTYTRAGAPFGDTDWYRFTVSEACTVKITVYAEFPSAVSAGAILTTCTYHTYTLPGYTCTPYVLTFPNVLPGEWEFTFAPWDAAGIPNPLDYRVRLDCIPMSGCRIDTTLNAPGTVSGTTNGGGNECALRPSPEKTIRVNIPYTGAWTFDMCGTTGSWWPYLYVTEACCNAGSVIAGTTTGCADNVHHPLIEELYLEAGTYYATIEGVDADEFGSFMLDVTGCRVESMVTLPGSFEGNTCGAGDDCTPNNSEEQTLLIHVPAADDWEFELTAAWSPALLDLRETCCGDRIQLRTSRMVQHLAAGDYYLIVTGANDEFECGEFTLAVTRYRGRCCYGEPDLQTCTDTSETICEALGGIFDYDRACAENPCLFVPPCTDGALFGQRPFASDASILGVGFISDLADPWQAENFEGVTEPIGAIRFWGVYNYFRVGGECVENPQPFRIRFYADSLDHPGPIVNEYYLTLTGAPYNQLWGVMEDSLYVYNAALYPPCELTAGWVSVVGAGPDDCDFFWAGSPFGDDRFASLNDTAIGGWSGIDLAVCLGGCETDGSLIAPGSIRGNTCGAGNDCIFYSGDVTEELTFEVQIPDSDEWTFSMCDSFDFYGALSISDVCCGEWIVGAGFWGCYVGSPPIALHCYPLAAGTYYVTVEGIFAGDCGSFRLDVARCRSRCCYDADWASCTDTTRAACEALSGIFDPIRHCGEDPCPEHPVCPEGSTLSQRPYAAENADANAWLSDQEPQTFEFESFSGLTQPILAVRFWGVPMVAQWPLPPCEENPMPFTINFYTDDAGQPGAIVASRWATLTGVEGETYNWMYSHVSYEYNVAFTQPVLLDHGWISIVGGEAADTTCHFYWLASPTGDGVHWLLDDVTPPYTYEQRDDDLSFCLTTDCPEADSLVLHHTTGNMFILSFWAPIDANYKFYYTTSTTAEYPTGFSLASQLSLTAGHQQFNLNLTAPYQRWLIVTNCDAGAIAAEQAPSGQPDQRRVHSRTGASNAQSARMESTPDARSMLRPLNKNN